MSLEKENKLVIDEEYYKKFEERVKAIKNTIDKGKVIKEIE